MLSIINNVSSVKAQNNLAQATNGQSSTIQKLSSGLRINTSADDPSGLAISERLRTQIRGLGRASMNAQDGISYMQTAEGALNETHSILQRMRELSIQAANGTLTASDRQEIQKEVSQLTDEVDRIATSTEYNTKKLLNGDAAALTSSSSDKVGAVVRGRVREGNYELEISAKPGQAHVLKTDIFDMKEGLDSVSNIDLNGVKASYSGAISAGGTGVNMEFDFDGFQYQWKDSSVAATASDVANAINEHAVLSRYIDAVVLTVANGGIRLNAVNEGEGGNQFRGRLVDTASGIDIFASTNWTSFTGGDETDTGIVKIDNPIGMMNGFPINSEGKDQSYVLSVDISNAGGAGISATVLATYGQASTEGFDYDSTMSAVNVDVTGVQSGGAYAMIEVLETAKMSAASDSTVAVRFSFDEGKTWNTKNLSYSSVNGGTAELSDGKNTMVMSMTLGANTAWNAGDKMLIALNEYTATGGAAGATVDSIKFTTPTSDGKGNLTTDSRVYTFSDGSLNKSDVTLDTVQLNTGNGDWYTGSIHLDFADNDAEDGTLEFDVTSGGQANAGTALRDIGRFYDDDGNFVLGESGKTITIYNGAGDETSVYIDGGDSIGEVADKINDAIRDGLGMGTGDNQVDSHIAEFIDQGVPGTQGAVEGTIVIRSTQAGPKGEISFSAEEDLLNALSLATIQKSSETETTVTVKDAHSGELIGSDTVTDGTLHNVIEGVDVDIDPRLGTDVTWNGNEFSFNADSPSVEYLHVVDNAKSFQIGANQNQTMDSFIGDMSAHALGVDRVLVVNQDSAQKSIGYLDEAIDRVSSERARIGAVVNRLEHTINNLNVQQENAIASESRIRDLDIAKTATDMAKYQILNQASTSMLAQANQMAQGLLGLLR